jgi:hypothetical protein
MRWLAALALALAPAMLALACGGRAFILAPGDAEVTSSDAAVEVILEVGRGEDASDAGRDAADREAFDAVPADSLSADAPDAANSPDVGGPDALDAAEEVPAHCGGPFTCIPAAPTGWAGPFELYEGSNPLPACELGFLGTTLDGNAGLSASAASCDCQCNLPEGVRCAAPTVTFSATSAVCPAACATETLTPGVCTAVDKRIGCGLGVTGATISVPAPAVAAQGTCAPLWTVGVPIATWSTSARACGASVASAHADCQGASVCVRAPSTPFRGGLCIEQVGDVACPATDYTVKYLYYGGIDDTRSCSSCTCGAVTGTTCLGILTQYNSTDGGCGTAQTIYDLPQSCSPLQQPADLMLSLTASNGACKPSPVSATGTATPSKPMTFCCTQ